MTEHALVRAMRALDDVKDSLVVVGGTAHRLFPQHPLGTDPGFALLTTEDVDVAAPLELQHDGSQALLERLTEAGFTEEVRGADEPAYIYTLGGRDAAYVQFLAHLAGSGTHRDGRRDRLLRFSGIHAEKLRHVDVLMDATWEVELDHEGGSVSVRVANPLAYLVQKLLVLKSRPLQSQAKDLLYIFDTLTIFGGSLDQLGEQWDDLVPRITKRALSKARSAASEVCFADGRTAREASQIAASQRRLPPTAAQIAMACRQALPVALPFLR